MYMYMYHYHHLSWFWKGLFSEAVSFFLETAQGHLVIFYIIIYSQWYVSVWVFFVFFPFSFLSIRAWMWIKVNLTFKANKHFHKAKFFFIKERGKTCFSCNKLFESSCWKKVWTQQSCQLLSHGPCALLVSEAPLEWETGLRRECITWWCVWACTYLNTLQTLWKRCFLIQAFIEKTQKTLSFTLCKAEHHLKLLSCIYDYIY